MPLQEVHTGFTFNFDGSKMAAIQRGVKRASTGLNTIAAKTEAFSQRAGGMIARAGQLIGAYAGFRVLKSLTSDYAKGADAVAKFSTALGLNTERYQGLVHAVKLGGTDTMNLNNALGQLSKRALEAGQGLSTNVRAFRELGVEYKDAQGNLKSADQLFLDVSDGLVNLEDKEKRTGLAMQLLGRSGKTLLPTMLQGSKAIREQIAEYKKLGGVLSKDQLKAAEKFNDEMLRVKTVLTGVRNIIAARLLPALSRTMEKFRRWWVEGRNAERAMRALKLVAIFTGIVIARLFAASVMRNVKMFVQGIWAGVQALRAMGLAGALAAIKVWAIVAAFAFVVLAIEDLIGFAQGKDSVIGRLLGDTSLAKDLKKALIDIGKAAKEAWRELKPALLDAWEALKPALAGLAEAMKPIAGDLFRAAIWMLVASLKGLAGIIRTVTVLVTDLAMIAKWGFSAFSAAVESVRIAFEDLSDWLKTKFPTSMGIAGKAWRGVVGMMSATVATLKAGMDRALAVKNMLFGVSVSGSISKARKAIAGAVNGGGSFRYDPSVGAPVSPGGPSLGPNIFTQPNAPHRRMPVGFGAGTDIAGNKITTNLGAGAVAVTVHASGDPKQIAAVVSKEVGKGINRVITTASRDLVKAPQGQR